VDMAVVLMAEQLVNMANLTNKDMACHPSHLTILIRLLRRRMLVHMDNNSLTQFQAGRQQQQPRDSAGTDVQVPLSPRKLSRIASVPLEVCRMCSIARNLETLRALSSLVVLRAALMRAIATAIPQRSKVDLAPRLVRLAFVLVLLQMREARADFPPPRVRASKDTVATHPP